MRLFFLFYFFIKHFLFIILSYSVVKHNNVKKKGRKLILFSFYLKYNFLFYKNFLLNKDYSYN